MRLLSFLFFSAVAVLGVAGCGSSGARAPITSATTTTLAVGETTVLQSATLSMTATVTGIVAGTTTGNVNFMAGGTLLGTASIAKSGPVSATLPLNVPIGTAAITATYSGNAGSAPSTSAAVDVTVQSSTTTTLASSPTSIQQGRNFVLSANVARSGGNSGDPTGMVNFFHGEQSLGAASLTDGTAQLGVSSSGVALGGYSITASYAGDTLDAPSSSNALTATVTPAIDVLTFRNDVYRTGVQSAETTLTPANVSPATFGKLYTFTTDGYSYPQPLYVSNYLMNDGNLHNVLFVETSSGSVYAFDADGNNPPAGYLWHISVNLGSEQSPTTTDLGCTDTVPGTSVVGTPVIDRGLGVMYLVAKSVLISGTTTTYYQRIHALNLADGTEALNGPTIVQASVNGTAADAVDGVVSFNPATANQRAALVEANGSVWIAWASHCDHGSYHGWVMGYNATDISQQTGVFNDTPNGSQGGIWMAGGGISADNRGNLFMVSGNGTFDANDGGHDYGDSVMRLAISGNSLTIADWFTPNNQAVMSEYDQDMGTTNLMMFDDPNSGTTPHLGMTSNKDGTVFLLDRDALGKYDTGTNSANGDIQDAPVSSQMFANMSYFNNQVYIGAGGEPLSAYAYIPGTATTNGYLSFTPSSQSTWTFSPTWNYGGLQPVISANGAADGIVWGLDVNGDVLNAFDAGNLANQIYVSNANPARDQSPPAVKFTLPVIANGKVYLAGQGQVAVYGLLASGEKAMKRQ